MHLYHTPARLRVNSPDAGNQLPCVSVPSALIRDDRLSPTDKLVAMAILDVLGPNAGARITNARLATITGLHQGHVRRCLAQLRITRWFLFEGQGRSRRISASWRAPKSSRTCAPALPSKDNAANVHKAPTNPDRLPDLKRLLASLEDRDAEPGKLQDRLTIAAQAIIDVLGDESRFHALHCRELQQIIHGEIAAGVFLAAAEAVLAKIAAGFEPDSRGAYFIGTVASMATLNRHATIDADLEEEAEIQGLLAG